MDAKTTLLCRVLAHVVEDIEAGAGPADLLWAEVRQALEVTGEPDDELKAAVRGRDVAALRAILDGWTSGDRPLAEQDKAVFKRAMKAFRKRLKLTRLDAESTISGSAFSSGRDSGIIGVTPPTQYPAEVWEELVRRGRLKEGGHGTLELPREE